jgi:hypothetical protein
MGALARSVIGIPGRPHPQWVDALLLVGAFGSALVLAALGSVMGLPIFWPVYVLAVLVLPFTFLILRARPAVVVTALVIWFAGNSLLVAFLAPLLEPRVTAWLHNFKEPMYLLLFAVLVFLFVQQRVRDRTWSLRCLLDAADWLALLVIAIVATYLAVQVASQPADLSAEIVYARRFASLPVMFLAGRLLLADRDEFDLALRYLVAVAFAVALFGLIERLLLTDRFWTDFVHVDVFRRAIVNEGFGSPRARLPGGIPANWTATLQGLELRRLVSTFLEPTTLGMFLALGFIVGVADNLRAHTGRRSLSWLVVAVIGLALVLTLGKGGALVVVVAMAGIVFRVSRANAYRFLAVGAAVVLGLLLVAQLLPVATNVNRHLGGLLTGVGQLLTHPLGTGLGSTGYWGEIRRIGNDSTIGAVAAQTGVLGAVAYVGWLGAVVFGLLPASAPENVVDPFRRALAGTTLGLLAVAFLSNSASGLTGSAFYLLFAGWLLAVPRRSPPERAT